MKQPETISPGMKGFLVTCFRNQESRCISELYDFVSKVCRIIKALILILQKVLDEQACSLQTTSDLSNADKFDFEAALKSEVKEIKSKKQNVLAIRNDVKGVVFFKASNELDVNAIFDKLVQMVTSRSWKPK